MTHVPQRWSYITARTYGGLPDRAPSWAANPAVHGGGSTRETVPMERNAPIRWMHPKLNTTPWSTSMAIKRRPMAPRKAKKVRTM